MSVVLYTTLGMLTVSSLLSVVRMWRGPTDHDRLVALDTLVVAAVCEIAVVAALRDQSADVTPLVVVALVGFISTVLALRLVTDRS